jgi:hypothetical protein
MLKLMTMVMVGLYEGDPVEQRVLAMVRVLSEEGFG